MATVKVVLPLTLNGFVTAVSGQPIPANQSLYFTVDNGELIISTEPLGDDPGERLVIDHEALQQGTEDLEGLRDWLAQGGSDNTL